MNSLAPLYSPRALEDNALPDADRTASSRRWSMRVCDEREALMMAQRLELSETLSRILASRGVKAGEAGDFLNPTLRHAMPDPFVLQDMEKAANRLADAIVNSEPIGIFGDYDVDGTTAAAILALYFRAIDATTLVHLPDRILEGYGPSVEAFRQLSEKGARVIVTVDCGAAAHDPVEAAANDGIDVVVFDHHLMAGPPPQGAAAVVNPNRPDDLSGLGNLSAAGVAFMGLVALNRELRNRNYFVDRAEPDLRRFLDLTALGLVCDVMALTGLTRCLVSAGLKLINGGGNAGLAVLGERCGVKSPASAYDLGFLLGPRINAAGRIGHARLAFDLLTTDDAARRSELAERLHVMNAERQDVEQIVQAAASAMIDERRFAEDPVIVVAGEGWHPGVIGIVAGRLKDRYDRPVIVIGLDSGTGKGSGRSLTGVDLGSAVSAARDEGILVNGGGHAMAAGLTIDAANVDAFRAFLKDRLAVDVETALASRVTEIDSVVSPTAVNGALAEELAEAGPFGVGNPEPVFMIEDVNVKGVRVVGRGHLAFELESRTGDRARAIAFRAEDEPLGQMLRSGKRLHLLGKIKRDDWRGPMAGQLQVSDAAFAAG